MSEWQPIDTAPRDGTPILAWPCDGIPYVVFGYKRLGKFVWQEASGEEYFVFNPTHWMPLPEPPKEQP